jgi:tripartite-type tricarboxylate transporter receptor subunit TctC
LAATKKIGGEKRMKRAVTVIACLLLWSTAAQAQQPFYKGKTITIVVGTKAGDVYDLYPRMLSEYLTKYIPGNPNVIIQNVPGAASLIAANQVYNIAKPDGLTIGAIYPALYFEQLIKRPEVKFEWTKFGWIGSTVTSNHLMYMRSDTKYKTFDDVHKASTAPKCGATGVTSTGYYMPKLVQETTGAKFDIVSGYVSGQDIDLAVERGEIQCRAFTITAYFAREPFISWRKKNFAHVLFQTGQKPDRRVKDAPTIHDLMDKYKTTEGARRLAKLVLASGEFGRPLVTPPGVPGERLKILRDAFDKSLNDPGIKADAEKRRLELDPTSGADLESLAKEVMSSPADVVQRVQKLLGK